MRRVYLDHNATTPIRPEVLEAMLPFLQSKFGNPNSAYALGQETRAAVEAARAQAARLLNAAPDEIIFTSCGSESNALAILGAAWKAREDSAGAKRHVVTSSIEHDSILELTAQLQAQGFEVSLLPVDSNGRVDPEAVRKALRSGTAVVSVMHANNEVGTIQPIREIAALCRERGVLFHADAVQSVGKLPVDVKALGVDLLSFSGHKINAPKGVGALFARRGARLAPVIAGHQEKNRRGGTENVASIAGLGKACELAAKERDSRAVDLKALRDRLEAGCVRIGGCHVNGHPEERLACTCHVSFEGIEGPDLVIALDLEGISASSGPACSAGLTNSSHVLKAMGVDPRFIPGSLRLSLGWGSSREDVDCCLQALERAVAKLREARGAYPVRAAG